MRAAAGWSMILGVLLALALGGNKGAIAAAPGAGLVALAPSTAANAANAADGADSSSSAWSLPNWRQQQKRPGVDRRAFVMRGGGRGGSNSPATSGATTSSIVNSREKLLNGLKNGLASGLAAACVKSVLQPFDSVKTVQQFSKEPLSLLEAGRVLIRRGGVRQLFSGLGVTLAGSMPSVGIYFGIYQYSRSHLEGLPWVNHSTSILASAGIGNFVASFFRVPYEVVKQQLQAGVYENSAVAIRTLWAQGGGFRGFYPSGALVTQWARDIPYAMATLLCYESMHILLARRKKGEPSTPVENMIIGALAGGVGSFVTNPMDVIKTRMMVSPNKYPSAWVATTIALQEEGPRVFMRGCTPRLLHKVPANGVFFLAYEFFRNLLGVHRR